MLAIHRMSKIWVKRTTVRMLSTNWYEQYCLIPEVLEAQKSGGRKAIPLLTRAAEICTNSMPKNHPLSVHALYHLACTHDSIGEYEESHQLLNDLLVSTEDSVVSSPLARALSLTHLKLGNFEQAEEMGWKAYNIVDGEDPITTDVAGLGEALQCVGLARLIGGDFNGATDYLQQATRMCAEGPPSISALLNLAAAHWWKGTSPYFSQNGFIIHDVESINNENDNQVMIVEELNEALSYYIEIINILNGEEQIDQSGSCMTSTRKTTSNHHHHHQKNDNSDEIKEEDEEDARRRVLKNEILKVHAMAGIGNVKQFHAPTSSSTSSSTSKEKGSSSSSFNDMNEASEAMFATLTNSSNISNQIKEILQKTNHNNIHDKLYLIQMLCIQMRALTIIAKQKQLAGLAVSSEGLYRSALSDYDDMFLQQNKNHHDIGCYGLFEKWLCLIHYQSLLKDWENRENEANLMQDEINQILREITKCRGESKGGFVFSSSIQLPTLDEIGTEIQLLLEKQQQHQLK